jgi:adenylyltransferase/sulfurtransferase
MTIFIPTPLRPYAGGKDAVETDAATIAQALEALLQAHPDLRKHLFTPAGEVRAFVNLYLNDEDVRYLPGKLGTAVAPADTLSIIPSIAGGCLPQGRARLRRKVPRERRIPVLRKALCLISLAAALPLTAQSVTQASPATMVFNDSTNGVSFNYPASWTFAESEPFYMPLSISYSNDSSTQIHLRGLVFAKSLAGVQSWPRTNFAGVEVGYDARRTASGDACQALSLTGDNHDSKVEMVTVHTVPWWHATAGSGGMGHGIEENIYTTYIGAARGTCLIFDVAIHSVNVDGETPLRPLTGKENAIIQASLRRILESVHIPAPSR